MGIPFRQGMERRRRVILFLGLAAILLGWLLLWLLVGPDRVVALIGQEHGYLLVLIMAVAGGVSTLTASSYFGLVVTLAAGGLNPFWLALLGGAGVTVGDSLFFFAGRHGRAALPGKWEAFLKRQGRRLQDGPPWAVPLAVLLYAGFTPLPNEFLTVTLGLSGTRYRRIILPLLLGNILVTLLAATTAARLWV